MITGHCATRKIV